MSDPRPACKQDPRVWTYCPTNPPFMCPICPPGTFGDEGFNQEAFDKTKEEEDK